MYILSYIIRKWRGTFSSTLSHGVSYTVFDFSIIWHFTFIDYIADYNDFYIQFLF
jgi:hypothetical protein